MKKTIACSLHLHDFYMTFMHLQIPMWVRKTLMKWVTWYISPLFSDSFSRGENYTVDLWRSVKETKGMAFQFVKEMDEAGVDVLLTPGFPGPGATK